MYYESVCILYMYLVINASTNPTLPFLVSFFLPDVLCDPTYLIWRKGTPFEAMTVRTALSSEVLIAEIFRGFPQP